MPAKILSALFLCLIIGTLSVAQDAPKASATTTDGRLEAALSTEVKAEMQAYGGEVRLKWIAAPGTLVKEGDNVAELEAPEISDAVDKAREALQAAEWSLQAVKDSAEQHEASFPEQYLAAQRRLERTQEEMAHFLETEKARQIRRAEMSLESQAHNIEDQKEELNQLKALYDMNNLAKESQDIVLNRSIRRLAQSEERYAMDQESHKRFLEVVMPRREEDMRSSLKSAELEMQRMETAKERGNIDLRARLIRAERGLVEARQQLEKLEKDAASLVLTAPHAGVFVAGGDGISLPAKAGDKLARNAAIGAVVNTARLQTTVQVVPSMRAALQPDSEVPVRSEELGASGTAKIVLVGMLVRDGKVAARLEIDNSAGNFLPGAKVSVTLPGAGSAE